ncbi:predicted protein [Botrytis cinerea T4]|uniref:Uncharacterized protein n=1 Tax=Botryotinia fuckeliana (strain T4) TaxID=999810 RepID=G2XSX0_BOTF4|nr:predicted protein [Botrytis cinerea T4]
MGVPSEAPASIEAETSPTRKPQIHTDRERFRESEVGGGTNGRITMLFVAYNDARSFKYVQPNSHDWLSPLWGKVIVMR